MSDKYQKEIEEILARAEEVMPEERSRTAGSQSSTSRGISSALGRLSGGRGLKISAGKLMLASFGLLVLAMILAATGVGSVVVPLVVVALVLFVIAYGLFFVRPGARVEKRWRGRIIEESPTMLDRLKRWLKG